jgi:hypothetical protein
MIHFQDYYVTISWDESSQAVILAWKGFISFDKLRMGLNKGLELYQAKGGKGRWLADTSQILPFSKEAERWVNEDWFPRAIAAGLKKMALVIPKSALGKMSVESVMGKVPGTELTTAYFDSQEAAKKWLTS